jgi:hypothetical protein
VPSVPQNGLSGDEGSLAREPVKCALPRCQVTFVPKSKDHKYCSSTCKKRGFHYRFALNPQR